MSSDEPKFRETLWFKKGELDADEASRAAGEEDDLAPGAADLLPIEDRYRDDGTISGRDSAAFGVHTGMTQGMAPITSPAAPTAGMDESELVGEMKSGRRPYMALLAAGLVGIAALIVVVAA